MRPFSNMELSSFCGQMALILKSGISSTEGLTIMLEDAAPGDERTVLEDLSSNMQETGSLFLALEHAGMFPSYMLHMVEIGEETGTLDEVMESLQNHYEREEAISRSIRNSITYPMIMTGMMTVVVIVLLVKVMPIFNQVFIQLGTEMTGFFTGADECRNNDQPLFRCICSDPSADRSLCSLWHPHCFRQKYTSRTWR